MKGNGITPESVRKAITTILDTVYEADYAAVPSLEETAAKYRRFEDIPKEIARLRKEMLQAAEALEFERAAELRDQMLALESKALEA